MSIKVVFDQKETIVTVIQDGVIVRPIYDFLHFQKNSGKKYNTLLAQARDLKKYWTFLDEKGYEYDQMDIRRISEFVEFLRLGTDDDLGLYLESSVTEQTINRTMSSIKRFYDIISELNGFYNPMLTIKTGNTLISNKSFLHHIRKDTRPSVSIFKLKETNYTPKIVSDEEFVLIIKNTKQWRDRLILNLARHAGARIGEILSLKVSDCARPRADERIVVFSQIESKGKQRDLYVPRWLAEDIDDFIFEERMKIKTEHEFLFVKMRDPNMGKPLSYQAVYKMKNSICAKTGVYFNLHDLRHTFSTSLAEIGIDISIRKIIMGHKQIETTEKYTHISDKSICESLARYWKSKK